MSRTFHHGKPKWLKFEKKQQKRHVKRQGARRAFKLEAVAS